MDTALFDVPAVEKETAPTTRKKERVLLPESQGALKIAPTVSAPAPAPRKRGPLEIAALYCDGGLLGANGPGGCPDGGTWAWRLVNFEGVPIQSLVDAMDEHEQAERGLLTEWFESAGLLLPSQVKPLDKVSNNLTELVAMIRGMQKLPVGWSGKIYSDSMNAIGRVRDFRRGDPIQREKLLETVPARIIDELSCQKARLGRLEFVHLDGHPSKEHLASGIGKRGNPVSIHNKWCDETCNKVKDLFWRGKRRAGSSDAPASPNGVSESPAGGSEETRTVDSLPEPSSAPVASSGGPEPRNQPAAPEKVSLPTVASLSRRQQRRAVAGFKGDDDASIQAKFEAFHAENPEVYGEVVRLAFILKEQRERGRVKWVAIGAIWERMRSNYLFEGSDTSGYKLNNNYRSRYARMLIADFPEFGELIETRELQSK